MWRKYFAVFRAYVNSNLEYRWELLLWAVLTLLPLGLLFIIWASIFRNQASAQGYGLPQIIQYYLLVAIIDDATTAHFEDWRVPQIREGKIDLFMTRPLSYLTDIFIGNLAGKFVFIVITFPLYVLAILVLAHQGLLGTFSITPLIGLEFIFLLIATFIVDFLLGLLIVIASFWFEGAEGLEHFKWAAGGLLSGWMVPIAFMPIWLRTIVLAQPFKYMFAIPIGLLQNTATLQIGDVVYQLAFIFALIGLALYLWSRARKRYGSYGG